MAKTVFVSGCYEILHAGHVEFFRQARALGERLVVCAASDLTIWKLKNRHAAIPQSHRVALLSELKSVNYVVIDDGSSDDPVWNFAHDVERLAPDIIAVTTDDPHIAAKRDCCRGRKIELVVLAKTSPCIEQTSTSEIRRKAAAPARVPLRLDFAGGWLDVPGLADVGGYVVNLAISPTVSLRDWRYEKCGGLGGSAALAVLDGRNGVDSELQAGAGWQDPAVISETGLCVWAGCEKTPRLILRTNAGWLGGKLAIRWTGRGHMTADLVHRPRDYDLIRKASEQARAAVQTRDLGYLSDAIRLSHKAQVAEGMPELNQCSAVAAKYAGSGWGGYAMYLFSSQLFRDSFVKATADGSMAVEAYDRWGTNGSREAQA